jgi:hypothetical protein
VKPIARNGNSIRKRSGILASGCVKFEAELDVGYWSTATIVCDALLGKDLLRP